MILVDTGALVALFDPADAAHPRCVRVLKTFEEPLGTTTAVLTEAFHLLRPNSVGARALVDFISAGGLFVWFFESQLLDRAFELMLQYADPPMDFADASLVVIAEKEKIRTVFTVDGRDFAAYRVKHGHRHYAFNVIR